MPCQWSISDQVNIHAEISGAAPGLVTRCDVDETADAILTLLRDADRRRAMGSAGRGLVQDRYTWPAIVDALTKEYEAVIERSRGQPRAYGLAAAEERQMPSVAAKSGKLIRILAVPAWGQALLRHRVAAGVEHADVLRGLSGLRTIVDVGANRGSVRAGRKALLPGGADRLL